MKLNTILVTSLLVIALCIHNSEELNAQRVSFGYDAAGNRTSSRTIVMSRSVDIEEEQEEATDIPSLSNETVLRVYPNPTKGILKIEVQTSGDTPKGVISIYSLSGSLHQRIDMTDSLTTIDISHYEDGVYLLKAICDHEEFSFKVIKKQ